MFLFVVSRTSCRGAEVKLLWLPRPPEELVTEYRIYRGIDLIATSTGADVVVNLPTDQRSTLDLRAVNSKGESDPSNITLVPYTPRFSPDLKTWTSKPNKVIFITATPSLFANYSYPLQ